MPTTDSSVLENAKSFLLQNGCNRRPHSGRTLYVHLVAVHQLLERSGHLPHVCLAGLFHSIYGTSAFKVQTLGEDKRGEVRTLIGTAAEELAWLFCHIKRPLATMQLLEGCTTLAFKDHTTYDLAQSQESSGLSAEFLANALISIEAANLLDQRTLWRQSILIAHAQKVGLLTDAGYAVGFEQLDETHQASILFQAKQSIRAELAAKINQARASLESGFVSSDEIRARKLEEATLRIQSPQAIGDYEADEFPFLASYAIPYAISVWDAAQLVLSEAGRQQRYLLMTEQIKDQYSARIATCADQEALNLIRLDVQKLTFNFD